MEGTFTSVTDAIRALAKHLSTLYRPYAGAQFRVAAIPDGNGSRFLTGRAFFSSEELVARPAINYKGKALELLFAEYWCPNQDKALDFLSGLLSGRAEIGGHNIQSSFTRSDFDHRVYPAQPELWAGWDLRSAIDRDANWRDISLPQGTLTARDSRTYLGPNEAINDWVFGLRTQNSLASDVPYKDTMVTVLPDTRARVVSARWLPGKLKFKIEADIVRDDLAIQVLHVDSRDPFQKVAVNSYDFEVAVPKDARAVLICVMDRRSAETICQVELMSLRSAFGKAEATLGANQSVVSAVGGAVIDSLEMSVPEPSYDQTLDVASSDYDNAMMEIVGQGSKARNEAGLRVFLCYCSNDGSAVHDLYERLKADGFQPWLDKEDLHPGQNWREEIPKAVRSSQVVVVCLSKTFNKAGYRQKEVRLALDVADEQPEGTIFLIPLKLEECQVPSRLAELHWANLFEDDGYDRLRSALVVRASGLGIDIKTVRLRPSAGRTVVKGHAVDWVSGHVEQRSDLISKGFQGPRNQLPSTWEGVVAAIRNHVLRLTEAGYKLEIKGGPTIIQVCPEGEIGALVVLQLDQVMGRIEYNCPVAPHRAGVPRIGHFELSTGVILGQQRPGGPMVPFTAEEVSEFLLKPAILER